MEEGGSTAVPKSVAEEGKDKIQPETENQEEEEGLLIVETEEEKASRAEVAKGKGNELYSQGQYREAIEHYTQAIKLLIGTEDEKLKSSLSIYYSNRAACHLQLVFYTHFCSFMVQELTTTRIHTMTSLLMRQLRLI